MRVRSFAAIVFRRVLIDDSAILVEQLYRDAALRRGGGNPEAGLHVLDDLERGTANRVQSLAAQAEAPVQIRAQAHVAAAPPPCRLTGRTVSRLIASAATAGVSGCRDPFSEGSSAAVGVSAQQFSEISPPRSINQIGAAAVKTTQQTLDIRSHSAPKFSAIASERSLISLANSACHLFQNRLFLTCSMQVACRRFKR